MGNLPDLLVRIYLRLLAPDPDPDGERGDVPGWVLITVMSVGIVTVLGELATGLLSDMLRAALAKVQ